LLHTAGLFLIGLLIFRSVGAEPYGVPTGSMAPTLLGNHKMVVCPRCGYEVTVGHRDDVPSERGDPHAECPNCGFYDLRLEDVSVSRGDHLLVNKNVFSWRKPRRWEMVVFRCPTAEEKAFVKRIVGLPGEAVQIRGGDIYIDGEIARKTLDECKAVRIPVFDNNYQPAQGWGCRWLAEPEQTRSPVEGTQLRLNAADSAEWRWLTYQHRNLDEPKVRAVTDEYSYNGSETSRRSEPVHDFMLECDVEVIRGSGSVAFDITDGLEMVSAELPSGADGGGSRLLIGPRREQSKASPARTAPALCLRTGSKHHIEHAFVDRRAILAVDGALAFAPLDRQAVEQRPLVERPVRIGASGVELVVSNVRIFRDVHYTDAGIHAVRSPVHLGAGEYFMLGDNSPNSDDNRFWSNPQDGPMPVPEKNLLGKPFLVHMPSRIARWEGFGQLWEYQALDWQRIRWLR
jgi:signal peptidase I